MAKKLYVAATAQHCGKTTLSISFIHLLKKLGLKVGYIKPIGQVYVNYKGIDMDKDAALAAEIFSMDDEDLPYMSPVILKRGFTQDFLEGKINEKGIQKKFMDAVKFLENKYDYLLIEGTGHAGVGSVVGFSNAKVAKLLNASAILICGGGIGNVIDRVNMNRALFSEENHPIKTIISNKLYPEKREKILRLLNIGLNPKGINVYPGLTYTRDLAFPSFRQLAREFKSELKGELKDSCRPVYNVQIGAASTHRMVEILKEASVLVVPATRDELIISMVALYDRNALNNKLVGMIFTGEPPLYSISKEILSGSTMPYFVAGSTSIDVLDTIRSFTSKLSAADDKKINLLKEVSEKDLNSEEVLNLFE